MKPLPEALRACIAQGVDQIDTPALVVDLDAMERNIARMAEFARKLAKTQHEKGMPNGDDVKALLIEISFAELEDAEERAYFNALPTSFKLPAEAVDRLREVAARLLRNSPQFQELLHELPMLD